MTTSYDAIVIGGGVIGSSIAFHLAKSKRSVLLVEKDRIGSQASKAAAGMLGAQAEIHEAGPFYEMANESRTLFPSIAEELKEYSGIDIGLVNKGLYKTAQMEEEEAELKRLIAFHNHEGQQAEWLEAEDLLKREPNLSKNVRGAMYLPNDGHVLPAELTAAFARSAAALGTEIKEFTEVTRFLQENGRIAGIETNHGVFYSENVVATSGVWTGKLLEQTGLDVPLYPVKGECFSVCFPIAPITATIISNGCYIVPKQRSRLIVGATMLNGQYDTTVSFKGIAGLMDAAKAILPSIESGIWEKAWAGLRPQTPDGLPILGEHPEIMGLYIAAGHFRNGIVLSPITGKWMAELIDGERSKETLRLFRVDRFSKQPELR